MAVSSETAVWYAGPLLVGALLSYFLYGACFIQTVYYFQTTPLSKPFAYGITLVAAVSLFELAHVIAMTSAVFHVLAISIPKGDLSFKTPPLSLAIAPLATILHVLVQGHFALRIRKLWEYTWMSTVIAVSILMLGLAQLGASFAIAYFTANIQRHLGNLSHDAAQSRTRMTWFVLNVTTDVIITITLVYLYLTFRRQTKRLDSRSWLNSLILHTIENGAVTAVFASLHIIFFLTMPENLLYLGLAYFNSRLYSNVLLASLNANRRLERQAATDVTFSFADPQTAQTTEATTENARVQSTALPIGARTEIIQFTSIDSKATRSRTPSEVGQNVEGCWKNESLKG